jgi:putative flippase GtrA
MKKLLAKLGIKNKNDFRAFVMQFIRFGMVGVTNTAVFLAVYYAALHVGVHFLLANIAGFMVSVLNAFFWSRKFVFKNDKPAARQLAKAYVAYGTTLALSTATLYLMVNFLGISEFVAPLINLCITVPLNFLINKFWAFK